MQKFQTQSNLRVFQQSYSSTGLLQIQLPETPNKITICLQKSVPVLIKGNGQYCQQIKGSISLFALRKHALDILCISILWLLITLMIATSGEKEKS